MKLREWWQKWGSIIPLPAVIVGASVILLILFVRLTCSTNPGETRVEIILLDSSYLPWADLNRRRIRAFEEQYPDIRVRMVTESSPEKILTMIAGGITPDVFMLATEDIPDYGRRGVICDVDRFMREDPEFDVGAYFKEIVDAMKYQGKLYGLPDNLSPVLLFYNKDVFDRFGVAYPDGTWRWREFLEACRKLTKDTDGDGRTDHYAFVSSWWRNRWPMYIWQNGGRVFTPERNHCLMDHPEAIEAIRWYHELTSKHHVAPAVGAQLENVAAQDASEWFKAGRVAMLAESRYAMARLRETPGLAVGRGAVALPKAAGHDVRGRWLGDLGHVGASPGRMEVDQVFDRVLWNKLRGEYLTGFLEEAKQLLSAHDKRLCMMVKDEDRGESKGGHRLGWLLGDLYTDWEKWVDEDLIDELCVYDEERLTWWDFKRDHWWEDALDFVEAYRDKIGAKKRLLLWIDLWTWEWRANPDYVERYGHPAVPWVESPGNDTKPPKVIRKMLDGVLKSAADGFTLHEAQNIEWFSLWKSAKDVVVGKRPV